MPARDSCQPAVVTALIKDGWTIVGQQIYIPRPDLYVFIDIEAVNERSQLFIEVKCFPEPNIGSEFYTALGQYLVYRRILATEKPNHILFLAIPGRVFDSLAATYRESLQENHVNMILVDIEMEVILKWIR